MTPLFRKFLGINWLLVIAMGGMIVFGSLALESATYFRVGSEAALRNKPNEQNLWILVGSLFFLGATFFDYRWVRWAAFPMYLVGIGGLVAVKLFGTEKSGAQSWLEIPGTEFSFQPSQAAIVSGILLMAVILGELPKLGPPIFKSHTFRLLLCGIVTGIPAILILTEPDLGSFTVWGVVFASMMLVGRIPFRFLITGAILLAGIIPIFFFFGLKPYQKDRITTNFNILTGREYDRLGAGYQSTYNMLAIGSGGPVGKGYKGVNNEGKLTIKEMGYIPANVTINDFIFVVIAEELGFQGSAILIITIQFLLFILILTISQARDDLGRLIVAGVTSQIFFHSFMNIGMCVLLVPITGLPLPLVSYGGTFLVTIMFMLGLSQSVWVHRHAIEEKRERPRAEFRG